MAEIIRLPDFEKTASDKRAYAESFRIQYENTDSVTGKPLAEYYGSRGYVVQNPPSPPLSEQEMDDVYELPYMRAWHPAYDKDGGIPAFSEIRFSLTCSRGCFGGCNFCALTFHEGRVVQARSEASLVREARLLQRIKNSKATYMMWAALRLILPALLPEAADEGRLPEPPVPVSGALPEPEG